MSVYVDTPIEYPAEPKGYIGRARKHARWCHMIADTPAELVTMAIRVGLRTEWIQTGHHGVAHYDLVPSKRALAIRGGAIALDRRAFVRRLRELKDLPSRGLDALVPQVGYAADGKT